MSAQLINWSKVPHTELVSDLEDNAEVAEAKAEGGMWRMFLFAAGLLTGVLTQA